MTEADEIRHLHSVIAHLDEHCRTFQAGYERMAGLLAKSVLSGGTNRVLLEGPHDLPPYHLATIHTCAPSRETCADDVMYHQGPPESCQPCLQRVAAAADRQEPDPTHRHVPGRPFGLEREERN